MKDEARRFYCDVMLGKLAQKLRMYGVDVRYNRNRSGIAGYREAKAEGRLFLTRNRRLEKLPGVIFVQSEKPEEQIGEMRERLRINPEPEPGSEGNFLSRCLVCNERLVQINREEARPAVPFFIYQIHTEFRRCPKCRRVFWPGSHVQDMLKHRRRV